MRSGTHAPCGTLFKAAPQKRAVKPSINKSICLNKKHTIEETECQEVCNTHNDGQMLDSGNLDSDEYTGSEHDGGNSKTIGVRHICKISEDRNDYNCRNHKSPVESRDVNLALDCLRGMLHANRRERSTVDDLLDKTESSRNQRL
jgi:hypothetical protein